MWIYRFLFVWDIYKQEDNEKETVIGAKIEIVYLKDRTNFVYKVDRKTFKKMVCTFCIQYPTPHIQASLSEVLVIVCR